MVENMSKDITEGTHKHIETKGYEWIDEREFTFTQSKDGSIGIAIEGKGFVECADMDDVTETLTKMMFIKKKATFNTLDLIKKSHPTGTPADADVQQSLTIQVSSQDISNKRREVALHALERLDEELKSRTNNNSEMIRAISELLKILP